RAKTSELSIRPLYGAELTTRPRAWTSDLELVLEPSRFLDREAVVEGLGAVVVGGGRPLEPRAAALAGGLRGGLDQGPAGPLAGRRLADVEVVQQPRRHRRQRGEGPVKAGISDQRVAGPSAQQETVAAEGEDAAEEGAVALLVDFLDF